MNENNRNLMEKLFRLGALLHRYYHHQRREWGPFGDPHRGQGRVLSMLKMQPGISQKDLSYLLNIRSQSLGELLAKLERSGLITRTPSDSDRRAMNIELTEEGEKTADETRKRQESSRPFDFLSREEQEKFNELLDKLIEGLEERMEEYGGMPQDFDGRWREEEHPHFHGRRGCSGDEEPHGMHRRHPGRRGCFGNGESCGERPDFEEARLHDVRRNRHGRKERPHGKNYGEEGSVGRSEE